LITSFTWVCAMLRRSCAADRFSCLSTAHFVFLSVPHAQGFT
jgi:hypothetical protein